MRLPQGRPRRSARLRRAHAAARALLLGLALASTTGCGAPSVAPPPPSASPPLHGPLDLRPAPSPALDPIASDAPLTPDAALDPAWAEILAEGAVRADDAGEITFTFDDGPAEEPWLTPEVLRLLREHHVRATFFLTGSRLLGRDRLADARRAIARRILAEGHLVGNHALDHRDLSRERRGEAWIRREIDESAGLIERVSGARPHWFRPPYGKLGPTAIEVLRARGDELALWSIDGHDVAETDPERLARRICGQLQFAGQGIVLLHDLRPASVQALAIVLQWLDRRRTDPAIGAVVPAEAPERFRVVDLPTFLAHAAARPHREGRHALYLARRSRMEAALGRASTPVDSSDVPDALGSPTALSAPPGEGSADREGESPKVGVALAPLVPERTRHVR